MNAWALRAWMIFAGLFASAESLADACLINPIQGETVSSRFGIFRAGGASNYNLTNTKPHPHDGLDFSTGGQNVPLVAVADGTIIVMGPRGTAGNAVMIKRPNGDVIGYYHLSGFAKDLHVGSPVKVGQFIGVSGNTNSGGQTVGPFARHLHLVYGVPSADAQRSKVFQKQGNADPFRPALLPNALNANLAGVGWRTDPSPYFCKTYDIQDGNPQLKPILGGDTKRQFSILNGAAPATGGAPNVTFDPAQQQAAKAQALLAQASGQTLEQSLSDSDGYGVIPSAPVGDYASMSSTEMMLTEAQRRFSSADWNASITRASSRALWIDYLQATGVSNYLADALYRKKERVEALLSVYTAQRLEAERLKATAARQRAESGYLRRTVN